MLSVIILSLYELVGPGDESPKISVKVVYPTDISYGIYNVRKNLLNILYRRVSDAAVKDQLKNKLPG